MSDDHPITVTPNPHRIRVVLGGVIVAERVRRALGANRSHSESSRGMYCTGGSPASRRVSARLAPGSARARLADALGTQERRS
jgi:hypothetical protein